MWYCTGFPDANRGVYSPWTYITKQATPSAPITWFNSVKASAIELPSPHPLGKMMCSSHNGNPPPSLYWEVNGTIYSGILETIPAESINRYTVYLWWDGGSKWQILDHVSEVVCKANHPGYPNTKEAKVQLRRKYEMKVNLVNDSGVRLSTTGDGGSNGLTTITLVVLGITLTMTIIISTICVIRIRRKRSSSNEVSPSSHACANATRTLSPGSTAPSTDIVLYEDASSSVRRPDVDANGYLIPLHVYEEIKEDGSTAPRVKGEDGYLALL